MDDQGGVRSCVFRMDFAEPGGHVGIEASDEWDARGAGEPGRADSGDAEAEEQRERGNDPRCVDPRSHAADRLHDALQDADVALADRDKECQRCADVEKSGENTAPCDSTGQDFLRILNFVAHDGSEFETDEAEANYAEGIQNEAGIRGNVKVGSGDVGAETQIDYRPEPNQYGCGDAGADGAEVIDPLSDAEADDVENHQNCEQH